jgi:sugar phosphate isomerase/epimerase
MAMVFSRRDFIRTTVLTSAGLTVGEATFGIAQAQDWPKLPLAVFSKVYQELKLSYEDAARLTADAGLDGIDCPVRKGGEVEPDRVGDDLPRYAAALKGQGVAMLLLTTGITGVGSPQASNILRTARGLGIRYYRLGWWEQGPEQPLEKLLPEIRASLAELAGLNRELGMTALLQNHSTPANRSRRMVGGDLSELYAMVKDLNPDEVGVVFDLGHAIITHGDRWREPFNRLRPHIRAAYIKDVRPPAEWVPFGEGEFERLGVFKVLTGTGCRAPLSIHIEYKWAGDQPKSREALLAALKRSREAVNRWRKA